MERNENGFPLMPDGSIDWETTSKEKSKVLEKYQGKQKRIAGINSKFTNKKKKRR